MRASRSASSQLGAGVNIIDAADAYTGGQSRLIVGKAIAGRRDDVVLAPEEPRGPGQKSPQATGVRVI